VNLGGRLNEVLQVGSQEEVTEVHKLAMPFIFDVDDTPAVLTTTDGLAVDDHVTLGADNSEGDHATDGIVLSQLFFIIFVGIERIQANVVVDEFRANPALKGISFLRGQRVRLGNDRDYVDDLGQFLHNNDVNRAEGVARGVDEEEAAVDTGVDNIAVTHGRQLLTEVGGMLVLDVFDDRVPAALVVDQVAITGSVDNVETQADAVLGDDMGDGVDVRGLPYWLVGFETAL